MHQKSFSSHLPSLSEELYVEIQKIKEEVEARCLEQKQREVFFDSILGSEVSISPNEITIQCNQEETKENKENKSPDHVLCCKGWLHKCLKYVKVL